MPADDDNLVKIGIRDGDGDVETPWAQRLGNNLFRLDNIPFFAYRISADDIVEAFPEADGFLMFRRVVKKSGNRTLRMILTEPVDIEPGPTLLAELKRLGCTFEGATEKLICVNIPPSACLSEVAERLSDFPIEWEYADPTYEDLFPSGDAYSTPL